MSFGKRLSLCGACFVLVTALAGLLHWIVPALLGAAGPSALGGAARAADAPGVLAGVAAALITVSFVLAVYLAIVLSARMRRDVERLRAGIRHLATTEKKPPPNWFTHDEFRDCAAELAGVAESLRKQQARLNDDAARDPLTGLPNRRTFIYSLARETAVALRTGWPLSLVMIDLDHFKDFNDAYGHQAGDLALQRTARRLASLVRESDVVARFGGEEFVVILPGTSLDQAVQIAQQLRNALRCDRLVVEEHELRVTASFGVAEMHECRLHDPESLINLADVALYQAKSEGRDTVVAAPAAIDAVPAADDGAAPENAPSQPDAKHQDTPADRDTMALMGSTFSILQVIPDKHRVAHDVIQQFATVLHCSEVSLFVLDELRGRLTPISSLGIDRGDAAEGVGVSEELQAWFDDVCSGGQFLARGHIEPTTTEHSCGDRQTMILRFPLVAYGRVFGVVEASANADGFCLSERQRTVLAALSAIGVTALKNCDAYERLEGRWMGLVEALCKTIHSTDPYKRDHAKRVSGTALSLARAMGQHNDDELQLVRIAGLVHDIGKIGLPTRMFAKRGRLRASERKLLERHCHIGAEILDSVAHIGQLADIVRHHHEHFDGGGYPDRLAGDEIPIESRILAVADSYVAMTSQRPYRAALSHDAAVQRIREASGTQFDPAIVAVFVEHFGSDGGRRLLPEPDRGQAADTSESEPGAMLGDDTVAVTREPAKVS